MRAEIAHYRANLQLGGDPASLARLRAGCAEAMRPVLPEPQRLLPPGELTAALLDALRFTAFPDAAPALQELRALGYRLVVVSNWDVSLEDRLAETGLLGLVDAAVASAPFGAAKPARAIFEHALGLADTAAAAAWHVGDDLTADVSGALGAGIRPVYVDRQARRRGARRRARRARSRPAAGTARGGRSLRLSGDERAALLRAPRLAAAPARAARGGVAARAAPRAGACGRAAALAAVGAVRGDARHAVRGDPRRRRDRAARRAGRAGTSATARASPPG